MDAFGESWDQTKSRKEHLCSDGASDKSHFFTLFHTFHITKSYIEVICARLCCFLTTDRGFILLLSTIVV